MKRFALLIATGALLPVQHGWRAPATTYESPVLHADFSDPDVIRRGEAYYLVSSSFHLSPGLPILRLTDLVHWTIVAHVLP
ncbi:beta-xylosidase [Novosphingobium chloroacetimidivorans]|uniref:Beta-xylosidase n=1 Tax=Novosphingobium chloroacetimidivorans TaxID=1428314 RepID=A0A7W7NX95_9SPHN|nr:beta-xylosidase [Novosphingobium chloroacetimidivorans]